MQATFSMVSRSMMILAIAAGWLGSASALAQEVGPCRYVFPTPANLCVVAESQLGLTTCYLATQERQAIARFQQLARQGHCLAQTPDPAELPACGLMMPGHDRLCVEVDGRPQQLLCYRAVDQALAREKLAQYLRLGTCRERGPDGRLDAETLE